MLPQFEAAAAQVPGVAGVAGVAGAGSFAGAVTGAVFVP